MSLQLDEVGVGEEAVKPKKSFYRRWSFLWGVLIPGAASAALVIAATILKVLHAGQVSCAHPPECFTCCCKFRHLAQHNIQPLLKVRESVGKPKQCL